MKSKQFSVEEGVEFYMEMHHIIESAHEPGQEFKDDAKNTALNIISKLSACDFQIDSRRKIRDVIKIRSSVFRLKAFLEIINPDFNKSFPNQEKKLEEIASICDEMIRSIDWTKMKKDLEENEFEEDEYDEEGLSGNI